MEGFNGHIGAFGLVDGYSYGRAFPQLVNLPGGAGNTTVTYPIGGTYVERIEAVTFALTTVGGAGVRIPTVDFLDQGGVIFAGAGAPFTLAAGNTTVYTFAIDCNDSGFTNSPRMIAPLTPHYLQAGYSVVIGVVGGLAADTIANVRLLSNKFSTAPRDFAPGQGGAWSPESASEPNAVASSY